MVSRTAVTRNRRRNKLKKMGAKRRLKTEIKAQLLSLQSILIKSKGNKLPSAQEKSYRKLKDRKQKSVLFFCSIFVPYLCAGETFVNSFPGTPFSLSDPESSFFKMIFRRPSFYFLE